MELIVTRKGAIRAGSGEFGLIPGSMGTGSYVVKGLGNELGYCSASHGAGRKMSRWRSGSSPSRTWPPDRGRGVPQGRGCGRRDPGAYKDLGAVVEAQTNLVEVVARLTTLTCVKG